jgi:hypothetical protein
MECSCREDRHSDPSPLCMPRPKTLNRERRARPWERLIHFRKATSNALWKKKRGNHCCCPAWGMIQYIHDSQAWEASESPGSLVKHHWVVDVLPHNYNPSTWEVEAGGWRVLGQPRLWDLVSKNKRQDKTKTPPIMGLNH